MNEAHALWDYGALESLMAGARDVVTTLPTAQRRGTSEYGTELVPYYRLLPLLINVRIGLYEYRYVGASTKTMASVASPCPELAP